MSDRITGKDCRKVAGFVAQDMARLGLLGSEESLVVEEGSVTYGRGWKVFVTGGQYGSAWHEPPFGSLWSKDARALWEKLHAVAATLDAVVRVQGVSA